MMHTAKTCVVEGDSMPNMIRMRLLKEARSAQNSERLKSRLVHEDKWRDDRPKNALASIRVSREFESNDGVERVCMTQRTPRLESEPMTE
jgi:hypothetical protein